MPVITQERARQTILRNPRKIMATGGTLLALDGQCLERPAFSSLRRNHLRAGMHLDILLVNPPTPVDLMLGPLPAMMEMDGVDYRLTRGEGELVEQIHHYLRRFKHVSSILLNCFDERDVALFQAVNDLRREGYRVQPLFEREIGPRQEGLFVI